MSFSIPSVGRSKGNLNSGPVYRLSVPDFQSMNINYEN